jgi:hypothetical protein
MRKVITNHHESVFKNNLDYLDTVRVGELKTVSDVATLLETFNEFKKEGDFNKILDVITTENLYCFLVGDENTDFDLFSYIQSKHNTDAVISSMNVKYLFPLEYSRGLYSEIVEGETPDEEETGVLEDECEDEDDRTTLLSEESELSISLLNKETNEEATITEFPVKIGRSLDADIRFKNTKAIGRVHCEIYTVDDRVFVRDLNSKNGTSVNGVRLGLNGESELKDEDLLTLAKTNFKVSFGGM